MNTSSQGISTGESKTTGRDFLFFLFLLICTTRRVTSSSVQLARRESDAPSQYPQPHVGCCSIRLSLATFPSTHILPHPSTTWKHCAVFLAFFYSAVFYLCGSALYHTSGCHSEEVRIPRGVVRYNAFFISQVSSRCQALDYSWIVVLTVGSLYSTLYYGFYCEPYSIDHSCSVK